MTVPSPPGRWNARFSARASSEHEHARGDEEDRRLDERDGAERADRVAREAPRPADDDVLLIPRQEHRQQQADRRAGGEALVAVERDVGRAQPLRDRLHAETPAAACMRATSSAAVASQTVAAWCSGEAVRIHVVAPSAAMARLYARHRWTRSAPPCTARLQHAQLTLGGAAPAGEVLRRDHDAVAPGRARRPAPAQRAHAAGEMARRAWRRSARRGAARSVT